MLITSLLNICFVTIITHSFISFLVPVFLTLRWTGTEGQSKKLIISLTTLLKVFYTHQESGEEPLYPNTYPLLTFSFTADSFKLVQFPPKKRLSTHKFGLSLLSFSPVFFLSVCLLFVCLSGTIPFSLLVMGCVKVREEWEGCCSRNELIICDV